MRAAGPGTRFLIAVAASLLVAGCGGGDGDSTRKVDRSGYFTKEQSEAINPALAVYDEAFRELDAKHEACSKASTRLFEAGKGARVAVKCHLDQTEAVVGALDDLVAAFGQIDAGDFRSACAKQLAKTSSFVEEYRDSWKAVHGDWERYADGANVSTPIVQQHLDAAYATSREFPTTVIADVAADCYTKADRTAAAKAADEDADAEADA